MGIKTREAENRSAGSPILQATGDFDFEKISAISSNFDKTVIHRISLIHKIDEERNRWRYFRHWIRLSSIL